MDAQDELGRIKANPTFVMCQYDRDSQNALMNKLG
jgi:hypothetical protein